MSDTSVSFIGAGNMASSLIGGLLARGWPADCLRASDPDAGNRAALAALGVHASTDNKEVVVGADVVVLAVKPQVMRTVCQEIGPRIESQLMLSIAAGVETTSLCRWLGGAPAVIRCMPNTPALIQQGASVLFANARVSGLQRQLAEGILAAVGQVGWVEDETLLHAVTALSGSGPAYFFLFMEALRDTALTLGLPETLANELTRQTAQGATAMAALSNEDLVTLRQQVTSPGGTTEAALASFEQQEFRKLVANALHAAARRSRELAAASEDGGSDS